MAAGDCIGLGQFASNAAVVIIGWGIVHLLSARRDTQKARKDLVAGTSDALVAQITELFGSAREYHTKPRDIAVENHLKMTIQDIAQSMTGLKSMIEDRVSLGYCNSLARGL